MRSPPGLLGHVSMHLSSGTVLPSGWAETREGCAANGGKSVVLRLSTPEGSPSGPAAQVNVGSETLRMNHGDATFSIGFQTCLDLEGGQAAGSRLYTTKFLPAFNQMLAAWTWR